MGKVELIDRKALLTVLDEVFLKTDPDGEEQFGLLKARYIIRTAPTVNSAPERHGHWVWFHQIVNDMHGLRAIDGCTCSLCGLGTSGDNFCEWCGARMDEEDNDG